MVKEGAHSFEFDLITIGAGSGGTRASRAAAQQFGAKVAVVELPFDFISSGEKGGNGGTCVIRGCVPKKLLVYGGGLAHDIGTAREYGWQVGKHPALDFAALQEKKANEVRRLHGLYREQLEKAGVEQIEGRARLVGPHTVEVALADGGSRQVTAANILVATGSSAQKAPIEGKEHGITSDELLMLEELPKLPLILIGAGYICMEFASIFRGLGVEVHLIVRGQLPLKGFDEECIKYLTECMQGRGVQIHDNSNPTKLEKDADGSLTLHYETKDGKQQQIRAGVVVFGTGRKPSTKDLGLEDFGVELDKKGGVKVDSASRSSVPHIWAVGDVTNRIPLTPVAIAEGAAVARTCFGGRRTEVSYENVPSAVFTAPSLATVGMTEEVAREKVDGTIDVYVSTSRPLKSTITDDEEKALFKVLVEMATDKVIGIHMVGTDVPEIMQGFAAAVQAGITKAQLTATIGIHPSTAEELVNLPDEPIRRIRGCGGCGDGNADKSAEKKQKRQDEQ